jgi:mono/diheme cytochrome c family protein
MKAQHVLVLVVAWAAAGAALADESQVHMKEAPETMTLVANCSGCHSLDYVQMNSKFMKRAGWEAEVHKMVAVMGAPVSDADAAQLVDYLTREYGVAD